MSSEPENKRSRWSDSLLLPYTLPIELEVIIDYGFAFVTYGNEIESKGVQFPGRDAPDKINIGG